MMFGVANIKAENNLMAAVSVFFGGTLIIPLILYFVFKEKFVRFYSVQAILMSIALFVLYMVLFIIGIIAAIVLGPLAIIIGLLELLLLLLILILWLYMLYSSYMGKAVKLPVIGGMAEGWA